LKDGCGGRERRHLRKRTLKGGKPMRSARSTEGKSTFFEGGKRFSAAKGEPSGTQVVMKNEKKKEEISGGEKLSRPREQVKKAEYMCVTKGETGGIQKPRVKKESSDRP